MSGAYPLPGNPLPLVSLRLFRWGPQAIVVDPVDSRAARRLREDLARSCRLLVYARSSTAYYVATDVSLSDAALEVLAGLDLPSRLAQSSSEELEEAWRRAYAAPEELTAKPRLGELLEARGHAPWSAIREALDEQRVFGGQLGWHLTSRNDVSYLDVAEAVATQHALPLVDLLTGSGGPGASALRLEPALFDCMPEGFWRTHLTVPLGRTARGLHVAMVDPDDQDARAELAALGLGAVRVSVTGYRDVLAALETRYHEEYTEQSLADLARRRPDDSAGHLLSRGQAIGMVGIVALLALGLTTRFMFTLTIVNAIFGVLYFWGMVHKVLLLTRPADRLLEISLSDEELAMLHAPGLPPYTVLVPAYREAEVLPILAKALTELDYPKDRLDVKLLLEADDVETIAAARAMRLPNYIEIVVVPPSRPQTKPKACNYGLAHARGDYVVIFDAEDIPERSQLRKAIAAFRKAPSNVACIQAKLSYFNWDQNLLTRWFTAEYAAWFDLLLPALHGAGLPIPLGGTSNHFRTDVLREVGAWDPFNVAEDADLGVRLYKAGYQTLVMDSTTYEEANSEFVNWVRQRSRWVKGYIQTWFVHMRHPWRLYRELGAKGFLGFQLVVGGTPFPFLVNPFYWLLTTLWFLSIWRSVPLMFPSWLYFLASLNLFLGNLSFVFINMVGAARRGDWQLVKYEVAMPVYWSMMSVAAWKAALQLISRPSYWEKTQHGLLRTAVLDAEVKRPGTFEA